MKYCIKDLFGPPDGIRYINEDTQSLENIGYTFGPKHKFPSENATDIKKFDDEKVAKRYLKEIKRLSNEEWKKHQHTYKSMGYNKPQWDIYELKEN